LKSILSVVLMMQQTTADAHHHRGVPPNQGLKGNLIATSDETP
jgi:hypothetical protein